MNRNQEVRPPLPPLPLSYTRQNEYIYNELNNKQKNKINSNDLNKNLMNTTYATLNAGQTFTTKTLCAHQKQLSKSVGDNLQQFQINSLDGISFNLRSCLSAGDLLGKTHEELILLLIQLKRNQSYLKQNLDKLQLQMESEDNLTLIEPHKVNEHKFKYNQARDKLIETQKHYESQFPLINLIDNMVRSHKANNTLINYHVGPNLDDQVKQSSQQNEMQNVSKDCTNNLNVNSNSLLNATSSCNGEESDYAPESDTNNIDSTFTSNRSSCTDVQLLDKIVSDATVKNTLQDKMQELNTSIKINSQTDTQLMNCLSKEETNICSNINHQKDDDKKVINNNNINDNNNSTLKDDNINSVLNNNKNSCNSNNNHHHNNNNSKQVLSEHEKSTSKNKDNQACVKEKAKIQQEENNNLNEQVMERMKQQQVLLEAELNRVRNLLIKSKIMDDLANHENDQCNKNENFDANQETNELHQIFQNELAHIDNEIHNLNAKKEKLLKSLKRTNERIVENDSTNKNIQKINSNEKKIKINNNDTNELFTDDDTGLSVSSIDLERVLSKNSKHVLNKQDLSKLNEYENEFVQSLKAEHEQNIRQQQQKQDKINKEQIIEKESEETTETTTIYKTLRFVKRKLDQRKNNKQFLSNNQVKEFVDAKNVNIKNKSELSLDKTYSTNSDQIDANQKNKFQYSNKNLLLQPSLDDELMPSEISQLLLDSALIIYEQLKPINTNLNTNLKLETSVPKRSTGSSISSERSTTDEQQSDEEELNQIYSSLKKDQFKQDVKSNSTTNLDNTSSLVNVASSFTNKQRQNAKNTKLVENQKLIRNLLIDSNFSFKNNPNNASKLEKNKNVAYINARPLKTKKKSPIEKQIYSNKHQIDEERARIY